MPSWKGLSEKERWSLVVFLCSLAGKKRSSEEPRIGA